MAFPLFAGGVMTHEMVVLPGVATIVGLAGVENGIIGAVMIGAEFPDVFRAIVYIVYDCPFVNPDTTYEYRFPEAVPVYRDKLLLYVVPLSME
jgi:hypothetical protein